MIKRKRSLILEEDEQSDNDSEEENKPAVQDSYTQIYRLQKQLERQLVNELMGFEDQKLNLE